MGEMNQEKKVNRKPALIVGLLIVLACYAAHYLWVGVYQQSCASDPHFALYEYFLGTFIVQCGNFGLVATVLWWFGWPMLQDMVLNRKKTIERDIEESTRQKEVAEALYEEVSEKMAGLAAEKKAMEENFAVATEQECVRIKEDAQKTVERIAQDARTSFELQANVAQRAFESEVMMKALESAREEIMNRVQNDPSLRDRLIEQGIASLEM